MAVGSSPMPPSTLWQHTGCFGAVHVNVLCRASRLLARLGSAMAGITPRAAMARSWRPFMAVLVFEMKF